MTKFVSFAVYATFLSLALGAKAALAFPVIKQVERIYYSDATFEHEVGHELSSCCAASCQALQGERTKFVATVKSRCLATHATTPEATCAIADQATTCPTARLNHQTEERQAAR